ncbi:MULTISPECIES: nuclear transport factor 2 family protein [Cyanophyceae]|uniref:Nuclear transport factor 2 family protein n=1 Tax=Leptolyngbya subtilissima DQ-A4 TaxID=2933933 RepID=A0ABV0K7K2_9CYAN|nr:nuclear transport factor 2 family protein [Nodosilinea sp. FACHB-141]MBD2114819.1 nuclear transport factor 2 family protein [Nodosilinea sp. FACHB-141]
MATRTAEAPLNPGTVSSAVDSYFTGFNAEDYRAVAALFAADGVLLAPFEEPIVGTEAIYTYLEAEAVSMRAVPVEVETEVDADGNQRVVVRGRVKTLLFTVGVRWTFVLTAADTIQSAEIKLMASLQELMQLDRG